MYSKATLAGHPLHPMLIAYPVAGYTGTLVGFAVYAATGQQFWLQLAIALNVLGAGMAIVAAVPGLADLALGVPTRSRAKKVGLMHAGFNVVALGLFLASVLRYVWYWNGPAVSPTLGIVLSAIGLLATLVAGFLGWTLVQDYHVGVRLTAEQELHEPTVAQERVGSRH